MNLVQQIAFLGLLAFAAFLLFRRIRFIQRNILLGKKTGAVEQKGERMKRTLLLAFGQKKMFDKPIVGFLHFAIYAGFIIINIEILEIILDGVLGTHRLFAPLVSAGVYRAFLGIFEFLALGVVLSCAIFLIRRNALKVGRFHKPEMKGWPTSDANIILIWEIALMFALYTMNAADSILQSRIGDMAYVDAHYTNVGAFAVSQWFVPLYDNLSTGMLLTVERVAWWVHIAGILGFAIYITYSKHLHIILAFPNVYFGDLRPKGEMENMETVTQEVKIAMGLAADTAAESEEIGTFGAKDVTDLSWKNLMDAYSCTECGRCTAVCPANITGKKLSPRKIMMDTRDRMEALGGKIDKEGKEYTDEDTLYGNYITKEELMACTTCNACVEACPVTINPLSIILQLRRYVAMEESGTPAAWNAMFSNIENNAAPWAFPATERFKWADELQREEEPKENSETGHN
ncbi:(Fe-S)-binding protein [Rapidithrix thailandica]|uniref:(Fe-S)-binding protein n=1 Tax=Rapidithrix thailandica TaxID=413964 RepID=A0AAW9S1U0_9BACT